MLRNLQWNSVTVYLDQITSLEKNVSNYKLLFMFWYQIVLRVTKNLDPMYHQNIARGTTDPGH